jgi:4-alpha-glucanotransferase
MSKGTKYYTGVLVPVFSLHSDTSTGEFHDLPALGRWIKRCGMNALQLLPVNETASESPYDLLSSMALNPVYLHLQDLPGWESFQDRIGSFPARNREFEYWQVREWKLEMARLIFEQQKAGIGDSMDSWIRENEWIHQWVQFKAGTVTGTVKEWPASARFHLWLQYHLSAQLQAASQTLREMGILLKGDLPFLLNRRSPEVREYQDMYDMSLDVGAPPDTFSKTGQNWQFPAFAQDSEDRIVAWWCKRIDHARRYYQAIRIDHVLGLFRLWTIPRGSSGDRGYFQPCIELQPDQLQQHGLSSDTLPDFLIRLERTGREAGTGACTPAWEYQTLPGWQNLSKKTRKSFNQMLEAETKTINNKWKERGRYIISRIMKHAAGLLICAEDLGAVPHWLPAVLEEHGMAGLIVERWSSGSQWPYLKLSTTSTHDTTTLRQHLAESGLDKPRDVRKHLAEFMTNQTRYAILPLQDFLAVSKRYWNPNPSTERINVPGTSCGNWRWKLPASIDSLNSDQKLIHRILKLTGRRPG